MTCYLLAACASKAGFAYCKELHTVPSTCIGALGSPAERGPTGVDKGGPAPNGWALRVKKNFFVKIEGLSFQVSAKSGRAFYDNPTGRGYFYQMSNMYTCIAYLIEIRKFC